MPVATALDLLSIEGDRAFLRQAVKASGVLRGV
jgi:hypothetical protein